MSLPAAVLTAPADRRLTAAMEKIAGLAWAAREVTRRRYEKFARLALLGGGAEATPEAFPELWAVFQEVCERLEVSPPGLFLVNRPGMGIALIGEERPVMAMESGALAAPRLWRPLLAQALTHLHCGHLPYLAMRDLAAAAADNLGILKSAVSFPRMLLEEWYFAAALSCDRGALWATDDLGAVLECLCALALPESPAGKLTPEALLAQGARYRQALAEMPSCPLFHTWSNLYFNLPRYALRAVEIKEWAEGAEYRAFRAGDFSPRDAAAAGPDPAYWGAFAEGGAAWESVPAEDSETADFLFGLNRAEWLTSGARSFAAEAENLARVGMKALGDAADAFLKAWKDPSAK